MAGSRGRRTETGLRIHQAIARDIGTAILSGDFAPGAQIGNEIDQAEARKVSRTAYREAMRILVAKGLLESRPKAGTHITPRERWNLLDPEVLQWAFSGKPDIAFVRDLFELRRILEPAAARLAALRRSDANVADMAAALDAMDRLGLGSAEGQAADQQFHRVLLAATGNDALASLSSSVGAAVRWTTHYKQQASRSPRSAVPEHRAVLTAIADRDEEAAAQAMEQLLDLAFADMAVALERGGAG